MSHRLSTRFFAILLRLYPNRFRTQFGTEMLDVFHVAYGDSTSRRPGTPWLFLLGEYAGLLQGAALAHWEQILGSQKGILMKSSLLHHWNQQPTGWLESLLASIPYLLFALTAMLPRILLQAYQNAWQPALDQLYLAARSFPPIWWALTQIGSATYWSGTRVFYQFIDWAFALFILVGLLAAWRAKWPLWSASYAGFGMLNLALLIIVLFPDGTIAAVATIAWLLAFLGMIAWMAQQHLFHALLAALPLATMFLWFIDMDGIIGWQIETVLFITSGLLMTLALSAGLRTGKAGLTAGLLFTSWLVIATANTYYNTYFSNRPSPINPTLFMMVRGIAMELVFLLIFTTPVWIGLIAQWVRGIRQNGFVK